MGFLLSFTQLQNENRSLRLELTKVKKLFRTALQTNLNKDLLLQQMQKKLERNGIEHDPKDFIRGDFDRFQKIFNDLQLSNLRSLDSQQSTDSQFLRLTMKYLYKEDLSPLLRKTATGYSQTEPITPSKMVILKSIFEERIDGLIGIDDFDKSIRKKRFSTILAKVINNIREHLKSIRTPKNRF